MGVPSGPFYIDDTLTFTTISHRFDTGALTDADGVPAYRIYEDETGTAILTGNMAKLDDASTTGFYSEQITLSAANGFEVGKSYAIYVTAAVNSVTGGQTFNFKVIATPATAPTAAAIADAVWDEAQADHVAVGSFGITASEIADILVDTAEIGAAGAGLTNINLPNQTMDIIGSITGNLSGSVGSVTGAVGSVTGAVGSVGAGGITAASFAANAITAAKLDPDVTTELQAGLATSSAVATLQTSVDDLPTNAELATSQAAADDATLAAIAALTIPTAAAIADQVWEETLTDHSGTVGSTAAALNAAGSAGDPWSTALPGAYGAGTAGKIIGDNINATVSSRATQTSVDDVDTVADAIKAKTDSLTFTVAGQVDSNVQYVNDVAVNGTGTGGDPWGP
jgi:hypothetical protein